MATAFKKPWLVVNKVDIKGWQLYSVTSAAGLNHWTALELKFLLNAQWSGTDALENVAASGHADLSH